MMYKSSRYWNRLAYLVIRIGRGMIWDQTGCNKDILLDDLKAVSEYTKSIMCGK